MWTCEQADAWADEWGFNCGPSALCVVTGMSPDELRPYLGDFESKGYTNPTLMRQILDRLDVPYRWVTDSLGVKNLDWPAWGLARVQWCGPWTREGVPTIARYPHTHWVASKVNLERHEVFDINATCVGGWLSFQEWSGQLVPWLLRELYPKASGRWYLTHSVPVLPEGPNANE